MPIFRKKITESSSAIFAIRAENKAQADEAFNNFFHSDKYDDQYEDYRQHMNESVTDNVTDLVSFDDEEQYMKAFGDSHNFYIDAKPKNPEPLFDVEFRIVNSSGVPSWDYTWGGTMRTVCKSLAYYSDNYIITPCNPTNITKAAMSRYGEGNNRYLLAFELKRREQNG